MDEDGVFTIDYVFFFYGNVFIFGGKVECFVLEVLADGLIELFVVETDEAGVL